MPFTNDRDLVKLPVRQELKSFPQQRRPEAPLLGTRAEAQQKQTDNDTTFAARSSAERLTIGKPLLPAPQHAAFAAAGSSRPLQATGDSEHGASGVASTKAKTPKMPGAPIKEQQDRDARKRVTSKRAKTPKQKKAKRRKAGRLRQRKLISVCFMCCANQTTNLKATDESFTAAAPEQNAAAEQDAPYQTAAEPAAVEKDPRAAMIQSLSKQYAEQIWAAIAKKEAESARAIVNLAAANDAGAEPMPRQFTVKWTQLLSSFRIVRGAACVSNVPEDCQENEPHVKDKVMLCDGQEVICGIMRATGPNGYAIEIDERCTLFLPVGVPFSRNQPADLATTELLANNHLAPTVAAEVALAELAPAIVPTVIPSMAGDDIANMRDVEEDMCETCVTIGHYLRPHLLERLSPAAVNTCSSTPT